MIGLLTPPVGMVIYILSRVAKMPLTQAIKAVLPFLTPLLVVLALITFIPEVTLYLPSLIYR
jgi:TRAP-type C4-dicarboxylate transport system permease large subunit